MAKAAVKQVSPATENAPAPKGKGKLLLIIAVIAVLLLAGGGAVWFMKSKHADTEGTDEVDQKPAKQKSSKAKEAKPPVFVNLEPFTVNLQVERAEQYLQVVAVFKLEDAVAGDQVKVFMPELRHKVLLLLSSKKPSEISGMEGREKLAEEIRDVVNVVLNPGQGRKSKSLPEGPVEGVLFTSFIIQ